MIKVFYMVTLVTVCSVTYGHRVKPPPGFKLGKSEVVSLEGLPQPPPPPPETTYESIPKGGLPSGYAWRVNIGPDFYVYSAEDKKSGVKLYFGRHPSYRNREKWERIRKGSFKWEQFDWVVRKNEYGFVYEALMSVPLSGITDTSGPKLHAIVWGTKKKDARRFLNTLEDLDFHFSDINRTMESEQVDRVNGDEPR